MNSLYVKISVNNNGEEPSFFFGPFFLSEQEVRTWAETQVKEVLALSKEYTLSKEELWGLPSDPNDMPVPGYIDIPTGIKKLYKKDDVTSEVVGLDQIDRKRLYDRRWVEYLFTQVKDNLCRFSSDGTMNPFEVKKRLEYNRMVISEAKSRLLPVPKEYDVPK